MRLLVVEDDPALKNALVSRLTREGYAVDACDNGTDGLFYARSTEYDALILDVMIPGMDGFALLSTLRREGYVGAALILTARDAVEDRVTGLDLGADDYLTKPFAFDELLARIRAMLRRHGSSRSPLLVCGDLTMDTVTHTVSRAGNEIHLTAKEYALLEYLLRNCNQVLTRGQICDHVWNYESSFETNLVDVYIGYLRAKIDRNASRKLIRTVRGFGYRICDQEDLP